MSLIHAQKTASASDKTLSVGACIGHKYQISELSPADTSLWCFLIHLMYSRLVSYAFSSPVWVIRLRLSQYKEIPIHAKPTQIIIRFKSKPLTSKSYTILIAWENDYRT